MLCPQNIFKLEAVLHFEKDLKKNMALKDFIEKAATFLKIIFMGTQLFFQL